jgi:hypothetical protein
MFFICIRTGNGYTGMPAAPVSAGLNDKLASTLLHEARKIKYPNKAQCNKQLVPTVPAEAINSVTATEAALPVNSFAPVTVNGISPIDLVAVSAIQVFCACILYVHFARCFSYADSRIFVEVTV